MSPSLFDLPLVELVSYKAARGHDRCAGQYFFVIVGGIKIVKIIITVHRQGKEVIEIVILIVVFSLQRVRPI
jgi:hypothetical protein